MITKQVKVETYLEHVICECGGTFKEYVDPYGLNGTLAIYPPQYTHVCDKCNKHEMFLDKYPKVIYKEVES